MYWGEIVMNFMYEVVPVSMLEQWSLDSLARPWVVRSDDAKYYCLKFSKELLSTIWIKPVPWLHFVHKIAVPMPWSPLHSCMMRLGIGQKHVVGDFAWHIVPFFHGDVVHWLFMYTHWVKFLISWSLTVAVTGCFWTEFWLSIYLLLTIYLAIADFMWLCILFLCTTVSIKDCTWLWQLNLCLKYV